MNLKNHLAKQIEWSRTTFGPNKRLNGLLDHIRKELKEIEENPSDVNEWIDLVILAFDGAWRNTGLDANQIVEALRAKQLKNTKRDWPDWRTKSEDEAIEHIRN